MNTIIQEDELKSYIKYGDAIKLSDLCGFSRSSIYKMVHGQRTMHPLVLIAIKKITESRINNIEKEASTIK